MNLSELETALMQSGLPSDTYCLNGGLPNEAYCIEHEADGRWSVYYSERGLKTGLMTFDTEKAACEYLFRVAVR